MDKNDFLLSLYIDRQMDKDSFEKYFVSNGMNGDCKKYYAEVKEGDAWAIPVTIYVDVYCDNLKRVNVIKEYESGVHGRPDVHSAKISASEYKEIYRTLDECFPFMYSDETEEIIIRAIQENASYAGYKVKRRVGSKIEYETPDEQLKKADIKVLQNMLEELHHDLYVVNDTIYFEERCRLISKQDWQPIFAILNWANPVEYENYKCLNEAYRASQLKAAIRNSDLNKCIEYEDALSNDNNVDVYFKDAIVGKKSEMLAWLFDKANLSIANLSSSLSIAIEENDWDSVIKILKTGAYDTESTKWFSPMRSAIAAGDKYVFELLKYGFKLQASQGQELYEHWTLDTILERAHLDVDYDQKVFDRIVESDRKDILATLDALNKANPLYLLRAYIKTKDYNEYVNVLSRSEVAVEPNDFLNAFSNGTTWTDILLEKGFDINMDSGLLLSIAASKLNDALFIYLIEKGANPHLKKEHNQTVFEKVAQINRKLDVAEEERRANICIKLLEEGVNPISESTSSTSSNVFYMMGANDKLRFALIEWLAKNNLLNSTENGHVPISYILGIGNERKYSPEILRKFISCGSITNTAGISDDLLFLEACDVCDAETLELFIKSGANIYEETNGLNGLYYAVRAKQPLEVIRLLVEYGLDVNSYLPGKDTIDRCTERRVHYDGKTVLDVAIYNGDKEIIDYLLSVGAKKCKELFDL